MRKIPKPPTVYNAEKTPISIADKYHGSSVFLVCSGPSLKTLDLSLLKQDGIVVAGVNNSPAIIRPNIWTHVDGPDRFLLSIWQDPNIMKFCPYPHRDKKLWNNTTKEQVSQTPAKCPNTLFFEWQTPFNPDNWIYQEKFNWGNSDKDEFHYKGQTYKGARSCMLVALKLLIVMGFRKIYLVGADFNMETDQPYAFKQDKQEGGCKSNNNSYTNLNAFMNALVPHFKDLGVEVFNTNKTSGLTAFPYKPYDKAINQVLQKFSDPSQESTEEHYMDIKKKLEKYGKNTPKKEKQKKAVNQKPELIEGYWDGKKLVDPKRTKILKQEATKILEDANLLTVDDLFDLRDMLETIEPSWKGILRRHETKLDLVKSQGSKVKGTTKEALGRDLINYFIIKFKDSPRDYRAFVISKESRKVEIDGTLLTLESFL